MSAPSVTIVPVVTLVLMSPSLLRLCASRSVAPAVGLAGDRVHARHLLVAGHGVDEHDAHRGAVLGAAEHAAALGPQPLARARAGSSPSPGARSRPPGPSNHASAGSRARGASSTAWLSVWRAARSSTSSGAVPSRAMHVGSTGQPNG